MYVAPRRLASKVLSPCQLAIQAFEQGPKRPSKKVQQKLVFQVFEIFQLAQKNSDEDFKACLHLVNHAYNFGYHPVFRHLEMSTRLLWLSMRAGDFGEAAQLVKVFHTFLDHPPKVRAILSLMSHLLDAEDHSGVLNLLEICRTHPRIPLNSGFYVYGLQALGASQNLEGMLVVLKDAQRMKVRLPSVAYVSVLKLMADLQMYDHFLEVVSQLREWTPALVQLVFDLGVASGHPVPLSWEDLRLSKLYPVGPPRHLGDLPFLQ